MSKFLISLFVGWLPGRLVFWDVVNVNQIVVCSFGILLAMGIVIAGVITGVGSIIRKIKKANSVTEEMNNPEQK